MEKRVNIFDILKREGKLETLLAYPSQEIEIDPTEHTKDKKYMNPLPIEALVRQISPEALHWKYFGALPVNSIEVITEKKNLTLIKTADKIKRGENWYSCYKDDSKGFTILERGDYIIAALRNKPI